MSKAAPNPFLDVRMRGFPTRTAVADVQALIRDRVRPLDPEPVDLAAASGRILAEAVVAAVSVPHFDRAAFDGYAVRADETASASASKPIELRHIGEAVPGQAFAGTVGPGEAVRIMTGSPFPTGADAVLPAEFAEEAGGIVRALQPIDRDKNVGHIGEDIPAGRTVLEAGRHLRPQDLGLLSSIGVAEVRVTRRPRVAILVTGNEILPPGSKPEGYRIVDSNSVVLRALAERDGGAVLPTRHLPDQADIIRQALTADDWDVLLVSGGTSVGREDHAPRLVAEIGELPVHGIAIRPAGPAGVGFIDGRPVFLLPGNPVACLCAYDLFAGQAVRQLGGRPAALPYRSIERPVAKKVASVVGRTDYVRVRIGEAGVEPVPMSGASILSSTVLADGFVIVPPESAGLTPGDVTDAYQY